MRKLRAAGGLVTRLDKDARLLVLVIHRPGYDDWTLPKGKLDAGEGWKAAAVREVAEETGVRARPVRELSPITYRDGRGRMKKVRYWHMRHEAGNPAKRPPDKEVDQACWLHVDDALHQLTYAHDRALLREIPWGQILLVRHAYAGKRKRWKGDDDARRPIDKGRGRTQARGLRETLDPYSFRRILSSHYVRCVQTVQPLAKRHKLDIEIVDALAQYTDRDEVRKLLDELMDRYVVVCTHGDVIEHMLDIVHGEHPVRLAPNPPRQKGSTWVLGTNGHQVTTAAYLRPAR